jgi:hypothetical protein
MVSSGVKTTTLLDLPGQKSNYGASWMFERSCPTQDVKNAQIAGEELLFQLGFSRVSRLDSRAHSSSGSQALLQLLAAS